MASADTDTDAAPKRRSRMPLALGLVGALGLGGAGFYAAFTGLLPLGDAPGDTDEMTTQIAAEPMSARPGGFVPIDPMVVSLGSAGQGRHLRFRAEIEVRSGAESRVQSLMPRILDVLNGYLRAVPIEELETPSALVQLRAQMLRRLQLIVGDGQVRDLLITEFVLN